MIISGKVEKNCNTCNHLYILDGQKCCNRTSCPDYEEWEPRQKSKSCETCMYRSLKPDFDTWKTKQECSRCEECAIIKHTFIPCAHCKDYDRWMQIDPTCI